MSGRRVMTTKTSAKKVSDELKWFLPSQKKFQIPGYRTKPRKVFYGTVRQFRDFVWKFFDESVWDRDRRTG